ncbi:hypothetical protein [Streptomyces sp. NPDC058812]|uniref:hypothetical protein n=1 Tax=unclassified Streptomyces TaxID=2593676 RepID=UPI003686BC13
MRETRVLVRGAPTCGRTGRASPGLKATLGGAVAGGAVASVLSSLLTADDGQAPVEHACVVLWLVAGGCALAAAGAVTLAQREEGTGATGP